MISLGSWLITIFLIMFWVFRVIATLFTQMGMEFVAPPLNIGAEITLLFVVLICIPFVFKRKILGPLVILGAYGWYFGPDLIANITNIFTAADIVNFNLYIQLIVDMVAIILPIISIFDILWDKQRTKNPVHKDTDWFYKNEQYDRKLDDRADKNNYRTGI